MLFSTTCSNHPSQIWTLNLKTKLRHLSLGETTLPTPDRIRIQRSLTTFKVRNKTCSTKFNRFRKTTWYLKSKTLILCKEGALLRLPVLKNSLGESKERFRETVNRRGIIRHSLSSQWAEDGSSSRSSPSSAGMSIGSQFRINRVTQLLIINRCLIEQV